MIAKLMSIWTQPYGLLAERKFKIGLLIGFAVFWVFFVYLYNPFGFYIVTGLVKLKIILMYVVSGAFLAGIYLFFIHDRIVKKHTIGSTIVTFLLVMLIASISTFVLNAYRFNDGHFYISKFFRFSGYIYGTNTVPVFIVVLIYGIRNLSKRVKSLGIPIDNESKVNAGQSEEKQIVLSSGDGKKQIELPSKSILYITSADNYVDVFFMDKAVVNHMLIRNTLTNIEDQLKEQDKKILRCHNSYIVNLHNLEKITGDSKSAKLKLKNADEPIPVSRKFKDEVCDAAKSLDS